jgi:hypothetical protein
MNFFKKESPASPRPCVEVLEELGHLSSERWLLGERERDVEVDSAANERASFE